MSLDWINNLTVNYHQTEHGYKIIVHCEIEKETELVLNENKLCSIEVKIKELRSVLCLGVNALMYNCIHQNKKLFLSSNNENQNEYGKYEVEYIPNKLKQRNGTLLCVRHIIDEIHCMNW